MLPCFLSVGTRKIVASIVLMMLCGLIGQLGCQSKAEKPEEGQPAGTNETAAAKETKNPAETFSVELLSPLTKGEAAPEDQWWWSYPKLLEHVKNDGLAETCDQIRSADSSRSAQLLVAAIKADGAPVTAQPDQLWFQIYRHSRAVDDPKINSMLAEVSEGQSLVPQYFPQGQVGGNLILRFPTGGDSSRVIYLAVAPDGKSVATLGSDGKVGVYDLATGEQRWLSGGEHGGGSYGQLAYSPDGKQIVSTGTFNLGVVVWDAATGEVLHKIAHKPGSAAVGVAFSPDGKTVVIGYDPSMPDGTNFLALWDLETDEQRPITGGEHKARRVAFSPDGKWFAANCGSVDSGVPIFDVESGKVVHSLKDINDVMALAFFPDGKRMAIAAGTFHPRVEIRNVDNDTTEANIPIESFKIDSLAISSDGNYIGIGTDKGFANVWDVKAKTLLPFKAIDEGNIEGIAFSPDNQVLITGGSGGKVATWDFHAKPAKEPKLWHKAGFLGSRITAVAISQDGKLFTTGGAGDGQVLVWEAATGKGIATIENKFPIERTNCLAISPSGKQVAIGTNTNIVTLDSLPDGKQEKQIDWPEFDREKNPRDAPMIFDVAYSPDGKWLATVGKKQVAIWNRETGEIAHTLENPNENHPFGTVAFSLDSAQLAVGCYFYDGETYVHNVTDGTEVATIKGSTLVNNIQFLPGGKSILSSRVSIFDSSQQMEVVDIASGKVTKTMSPIGNDTYGQMLCDEGKTAVLLCGGWLEFWDPVEGTRLAAYKIGDTATRLAVSAEGSVLVGHKTGYFQLYRWHRP
ncbi:hypothetical protein GC197_03015 [bacterium]|nr:hypothetical protein [bacterium]